MRTILCRAKAVLLTSGALVFAASASSAQQAPSTRTIDYVTAAVQSDTYEIEAAQDALAQSQDPQVRAFAQMMTADHGATSATLAKAAAASGIVPPPPSLGGDQQHMLAALQGLTEPEFDKAYWRQQALAHQQALIVTQGYAATGPDANVRQAAQSALPVIQHHLDMARAASQP